MVFKNNSHNAVSDFKQQFGFVDLDLAFIINQNILEFGSCSLIANLKLILKAIRFLVSFHTLFSYQSQSFPLSPYPRQKTHIMALPKSLQFPVSLWDSCTILNSLCSHLNALSFISQYMQENQRWVSSRSESYMFGVYSLWAYCWFLCSV